MFDAVAADKSSESASESICDPEPENEFENDISDTNSSVLKVKNLWNMYTEGLDYLTSLKEFVFDNEEKVAEAENMFLRCLSHKYYRYNVEISDECKVWTLSSVPYPRINPDKEDAPSKPAVVLVHGLLAGLAYWAMNLDSIVDTGRDVYAFDLPGFARSSRIEFSEDAEESEAIYVDIFEQWRKKLGLGNILIIGHSFGGYLSTAYALKYPQSTVHVILVDPWGFPDVREEVTTVVESVPNASDTPFAALPTWMRVFAMILMPFSPFSFLRMVGRHFGPRMIHMIRPDMTSRFSRIFGEDDNFTVSNYIYHTNKLSPTGENAFRSMSMPIAWAKNPLIKRIGRLSKNMIISFIYGSRSWIDYQTGFEVKDILTDNLVNVHVIDGAGHHLFADEPEIFNSLIQTLIRGNFIGSFDDDAYKDCLVPLIKDVSMR